VINTRAFVTAVIIGVAEIVTEGQKKKNVSENKTRQALNSFFAKTKILGTSHVIRTMPAVA
jgi:hypothetical protein